MSLVLAMFKFYDIYIVMHLCTLLYSMLNDDIILADGRK